MLSGSGFATDGDADLYFREYDTPETNRGVAYRRDGDRAWNFLGSLSYGDFTLRGGWVTREKDVPTGSYGTLFDAMSSTLDERGFVELAYAHTTANDWTFNGRASYDTYHYQGYSDYALDEEGGQVLNDDSADGRWWGFEANASHQFFNRFRLTFGVEYRRALELTQGNFDDDPRFVYADVSSDLEVFGAFADGSLEITRWLKLVGGLRFDRYDSFGETENPRFGVIVQPWEHTTFKFLYGEAFRAPNSYELAYSGIGQQANPMLQPERIRTTELVAEHYFDAHWRASASLFQNDIVSLVDTRTDPNGDEMFVNTGDARVRGAEVEVEGKWESGLLVRASYTRHLAEESESGEALENSPRDAARAHLAMPIFGEKLSAGVELLYQSDRFTLRRDRTGDTWLLNLTLLSRELRPGLEISASLYNLLDARYRTAGGPEHLQDRLEQDGRTFRLKLSYRF
jgi:iron complex outermembrane receptor protein